MSIGTLVGVLSKFYNGKRLVNMVAEQKDLGIVSNVKWKSFPGYILILLQLAWLVGLLVLSVPAWSGLWV